MPINVVLADTFYSAARKLRKRYPHLLDDVDTLVVQLKEGEIPGDRIQGLNHRVYKVRLKNSDAQRGQKRRLSGHLLPRNRETDGHSRHL